MPTPIQWCDETFNPWWGCERVSPACAHCYADDTARFRTPGLELWGDGHEFRFFGDGHWAEPLRWARTLPAKLGRRPRVFCASMADVFEERDELVEHRIRLFKLVDATPELDWLILTKRPEAAGEFLSRNPDGPFMPNVWLGVSIENARFTWRADVLREIPAAVRFISAEPLLGSLFVGEPCTCPDDWTHFPFHHLDCRVLAKAPLERRNPLDLTGIDWVIIGGESGPKARPFHLEHAREIIGHCMPAADAPLAQMRMQPAVFVKQLGAKPTTRGVIDEPTPLYGIRDRKGGDMDEWPADLRIREFPASASVVA